MFQQDINIDIKEQNLHLTYNCKIILKKKTRKRQTWDLTRQLPVLTSGLEYKDLRLN